MKGKHFHILIRIKNIFNSIIMKNHRFTNKYIYSFNKLSIRMAIMNHCPKIGTKSIRNNKQTMNISSRNKRSH